jgi:tRNA-2-methylthio-N6-dimethylallyladenosine synthase
MKVLLQTFGCQMNKLDSALIEASLRGSGFNSVDSVDEADVVLFNTCSVRNHAEQRVLSHLGHLKHIKESRPDLVVAVVGCMAQRLGGELFKQSAVDIVCGPAQIADIPRLIDEALGEKKKAILVTEKIRQLPPDGQELENFETEYGIEDGDIPSQAYIRAMHGCDKFCSYCVVPYVRGPETSRPPAAIIEQTKRLAQNGVKQVTLLGQRINAYEYKTGDKTYCLADLLGMISDIDGIEWIRFVTSYPSRKYFAEIMQAIVALPKVCRYLHLPAQSGSDKILKAMNRGYTSAEYLALIDTARQIVPDIAIAGDSIVGFPGETDDDFAQTVELVKKAQYKNSFIFKYSPRPGTTADNRLENNIPQEIKIRRNIGLLKIQEEISNKLAQAFLGKTVKVLVEGPSKKSHLDNPQLVGRTASDWIVVFEGDESLAGQFVNVKISKTTPLTLFGELTNL